MHIPVLPKEVLQYLDPKPNDNFIDGTVGQGGHAFAILERTAPRGKVLGIDQDPEQIKNLKSKSKEFKGRLILANANFAGLKETVQKNKFSKIDGILLDLGMSSWHLEESGRGFSFQKKEPLDMRYSSETQLTAEKIVNFWSKFEIEKILKEYGEEEFSWEIAEQIVEARKARPIVNTLQLAEIIIRAAKSRKRIHPATLTFQALRIAVNDELRNLREVLPQALEILKPQGKIAVISFHSLEDRIVKEFYRALALSGKLKILTKKPVVPSFGEIKANPRARSAKLRVAQKI